jgi:hypothetical protein
MMRVLKKVANNIKIKKISKNKNYLIKELKTEKKHSFSS